MYTYLSYPLVDTSVSVNDKYLMKVYPSIEPYIQPPILPPICNALFGNYKC